MEKNGLYMYMNNDLYLKNYAALAIFLSFVS